MQNETKSTTNPKTFTGGRPHTSTTPGKGRHINHFTQRPPPPPPPTPTSPQPLADNTEEVVKITSQPPTPPSNPHKRTTRPKPPPSPPLPIIQEILTQIVSSKDHMARLADLSSRRDDVVIPHSKNIPTPTSSNNAPYPMGVPVVKSRRVLLANMACIAESLNVNAKIFYLSPQDAIITLYPLDLPTTPPTPIEIPLLEIRARHPSGVTSKGWSLISIKTTYQVETVLSQYLNNRFADRPKKQNFRADRHVKRSHKVHRQELTHPIPLPPIQIPPP